MKYWLFFLCSLHVFAAGCHNPCDDCRSAQGWSFDLGGQYTWMSLTTPPTFTGNTGGVMGKITYDKSDRVFGQLRSVYNIGELSNDSAESNDCEWYSEVVAGYRFSPGRCWSVTPYAGLGLDFLWDHKESTPTLAAIHLNYRFYYAVFGVGAQYSWQSWYLGLQADCLPIYHEYLSIGGLTGAAWKMEQRVGWAARLPIGYEIMKHMWIEVTPYYRYLPIGSSKVLVLPERNLNQAGVFAALRFFL